ncbi:MAG: patatin [Okeania sp. SIO2D1]|uniref:patatin-like phospholipase family protein n=1 Tax=Okeania sp. SIO2C9 TaxID=2607791 RepID=UPI0013B5F4F2|nr:patatin-like phospholipase family protein [Okeania sp. SIO2C9]NEQ75337.1 patatin [Okeania sp. SIO2C9]NES67301.1 patatin [Okeania sp. SIO2D1]
MSFKILCLDGGGIRGVLSAKLLQEVETTVKEKKGQELHEYFDLISGTSTGSILAAGVVCQMKAKDMIDIYLEEGKNIFLESVRQQRNSFRPSTIMRKMIGSYALYPHEQGEQGLAKILQKKLIHQELGSPKISEITRPHILIPAYDVYSRNTTWFTNNPPNSGVWYDNIELWKICTASASAPTFFPPYELPYNEEESLPHIDGGVSANNPVLVAIAHALWIQKNNGLKLSDIAVLSIGTGNTTCPYSYEEIKEWGLLGWVQHIPDIFLNPSAKNSEDICNQILDSVGGDILRLDFDLNDRLAREKQPGRVRKLLEKPHNRYIRDKRNHYQEINEDIDDPDNCQDLIDAAECYLDCGDVYYEKPRVPVREAIQKFIGSH